VTRRAALAGTAALALALVGWGAAHNPGGRRHSPMQQPVVLPVRVIVLDPANGAVIWSTVAMPRHMVLDPATGRAVTAGASTSAP
jgi:hypothetical protein